jgi:hypothetical protein
MKPLIGVLFWLAAGWLILWAVAHHDLPPQHSGARQGFCYPKVCALS